MEIKTLAELTTLDGHIRVMSRPIRTSGTPTTELSPLVDIQRMVADCDLAPAVPEHVRAYFEICWTLHTYGCLAYECFTVAARRACAAIEATLGARFVEFYAAGMPLENRKTGAAGTRAASQATAWAAGCIPSCWPAQPTASGAT